MESGEIFVKSEKLRIYLVAFRVIALLLALIITGFNNTSESVAVLKHMIPSGIVFQVLTSFMLIAYHFLASVIFLKYFSNKTNLTFLMVFDCLTGLICCACFGSIYLLLALALPVLEAAFGDLPWTVLLTIAGVICVIIIALEFALIGMSVPSGAPDEAPAAGQMFIRDAKQAYLSQSVVLTISFIISVVWGYLISLKLEAEKVFLYQQAQEEQNRIIEDTVLDKETIQGLSNALIAKEIEIEKYRDKVTEAQEELEKNYKKYHDQKNQYIAQGELFREKEQELNQIFEKKALKMEQDVLEYKKQSDKSKSLLEMSVELNKSLNLQEAYVSVIEHLLKLIPVQTCIIFMLDTVEGRTELFAEMVYSPYSDFFRNFSVRIGEGLPGLVAERQKAMIVDGGST